MKLLDVVNAPWAIQPAALVEIREIYATHLRGEKINLAGIEAQLGRPLANGEQGFEVIEGTAVIPVHGVIAKRMNLFSQISGGASTQLIERDIRGALADDSVENIILDVDSPGGTVDGTAELASIVRQAGLEKPVIALASGLMASAAYWIGSAAQAIYMSGPTTTVGSIGVVATHVDVSKNDEQRGVKRTEIYAGQFKRIASSFEPLTPEGRESIQAEVDYLYSLFVGAVAENRGVAIEQVLEDMADGRLFIGQQAIDAGLVDGVSTLDQLVASLSSGDGVAFDRLSSVAAGDAAVVDVDIHSQSQTEDAMSNDDKTVKVSEISLGYLKANHADLLEGIETAAFDNGHADGVAAGATAECARIKSVHEQTMVGHEDLVATAMFDGKSTGPDVAVQILAAEKGAREKIAGNLAGDAPKPLPVVIDNSTGLDTDAPAAEDDSLPLKDRAQATWDADKGLRAEFGGDFDTYLSCREAEEGGRVRVMGQRKAS